MGAVRNAQLAPVTFPGWVLRFYVEKTEKPRYPAVPASILRRLVQLGVELVDAPADRLAPMMWRFTVSASALETEVCACFSCLETRAIEWKLQYSVQSSCNSRSITFFGNLSVINGHKSQPFESK